ncbi:SusC/RagA family TonB-linked outer membrane protein [Catalinimonas sp. 4WD22]|uniref:SusC/RagA family TonB-linked outer membrane protein n=1 Tax=Catalinimonas locisalis TaxID=3133978 RepID=UPI0031016AF6
MRNIVRQFRKILLLIVVTCVQLSVMAQEIAAIGSSVDKEKTTNLLESQQDSKALASVLNQLEFKYNVHFNYASELVSNRLVDLTKKINDSSNLEELLDQLLSPLGLQYERIEKDLYLIFEEKNKLPNRLQNNLAPDGEQNHSSKGFIDKLVNSRNASLEKTISGKVSDGESGEPLPGVNILAKETTNGTVTDVNGNYRLTVSDGTNILIFSSIGYLTKEVEINSQNTINVSLMPDIKSLSEVVVVGYGTVKKEDLTGSVASVSSEEIKEVQTLSIDNALQGRVSGVDVTQTSGQPGAVNRVRIRGGNSISAGNEPLYVIDGFPVYNDNSAANSGAARSPGINALSTINPADIASIEVLKDASATAIYGSRGANGVIIITTKRGKAGRNNIALETNFGLQNVRNTIPVLNAQEYALFENEIFEYQRDVLGQDQVPVYTNEQIANLGEGTNWQDEIFRIAPIQNYQLSFSGGNQDMQYAITGGYTNQQGIITNSDFERYSLRLNLDRKIGAKIRIGNSSTVSQVQSDLAYTGAAGGIQGASSSITAVALHFNPITPVRDPQTGDFSFQDVNVGEVPGAINRSVPYYNPVALATLATNNSTTTRLLNNVFGEIDILENLTFRTSVGADYMFNKQNSYFPSNVRLASDIGGDARIGSNQNLTWLNENTIRYRYSNELHSLDLLGGFTFQSSRQEQFQIQDRGFVNDNLAVNNIGTGSNTPPLSRPYTGEWGLISYLTRANYILDNRYLFTATARYDGSSRFGQERRWGFFPSAAFSWKLSEETFIQDLKLFSNLKLRTSYGLTGNQEIGLYQSLSGLGSVIYTFDGVPTTGFAPNRIANPDLRWETTAQFNVGLDIGLLKGRVNMTADYYRKKTDDLLLNVQIPSTSGFTNSLQNIGGVLNRGVELGINAILLEGDFSWDVSFNIAANRNEITSLGDENQRLVYSGWNVLKGQPASILQVGEPTGNFYGWQTNGIFLTDEEAMAAPDQTPADGVERQLGGNIRYVDLNNDDIVNDEDRGIIGNALPDFTGGFSTKISYKGLELSSVWAYSYGNEVMNFNKLEFYFGIGRYNAAKEWNNRWSYQNTIEENRNATAPTVLDGRNLFSAIDKWVEDASFLRMRNISLSYNLPFEKMGMGLFKASQVYISAQNLITFTKYSGFDPEVNLAGQDNLLLGYDYGAYPTAKTYNIGLKLNF